MVRTKKITQNINKDAGLLDMPKVKVDHSKWGGKNSNYITCNIGDIVPIYVDEVLPSQRSPLTMGMLSHMTTPIAPIFNAQYTEFRSFFVPFRLCADLLGGYKTRKSPWVKVFGEDNASADASVIVSLENQKLPDVSNKFVQDARLITKKAFGGLFDALDYEPAELTLSADLEAWYKSLNFMSMAAYELIYQKAYRNQNRESATSSNLYKFLFDAYNRSSNVSGYDDSFHVANREKDYFTGSQPFTQKGDPVRVGILGDAPVIAKDETPHSTRQNVILSSTGSGAISVAIDAENNNLVTQGSTTSNSLSVNKTNLYANLNSATGVDINQLRVMVKTQEMLEKDMMYGSDYSSSLNAHFGTAPISLELDEPIELKKVIITSEMQAIFQTSTTANEQTILGTIGANATTRSGEFDIVPSYEFKEHGYVIICAVHKAQNSYDAMYYKPKHIFKKNRFDFYTPELNDLGYQPVTRYEFSYCDKTSLGSEAVSYNEAWAEYRFKFNSVHGMFEPSRSNALSYWTLSVSNVADIQSLYKQSTTELDRAISVTSTNAPQFFDAYGFVEVADKPMSLHSIPGMDGVI